MPPSDVIGPTPTRLQSGSSDTQTRNVDPDGLTEDQRVLFAAVLWMLMVLMLLVAMDGRHISRETRVGEVGLCTG